MEARARTHVQLLEQAAFFPVWLLCGFTVLYHAGLWLGASLHDLISISLVCVVFYAGYLAWAARRNGMRTTITVGSGPYRGLLALALLGVLAASIALLGNRPSDDDVNYLAHAVLTLSQPDQPLIWRYPFAGMADSGRYFFDIFQSYPFLITVLASLAGVQPLDVYHLAIPVLGGLGFVLAWFLLLYRLTGNWGGAIVGTLVLVVLAATDGVTHRSTANIGLYRIWQGKILLMQIIMPLVVLATLDALEKTEPRRWWRLFALSVAGIGLTSSAQFFLPILAGLVSLSYAIAQRKPRLLPQSFGIGLLMGIYSLPFTLAALQQKGDVEFFGLNFASSLTDMLRVVYGFPSITLGLAAVMVPVLLRLKEYAHLQWLLIWCGLLFVPLSVTPVADFVVTYVTTNDAFWRLAYASPILLLIGLGAAHAYNTPAWRKATSGFVMLFCATAVGLALLPLEISPLSRSYVRFPSLDYKLPAAREKISLSLVEALSGGSMLAADELSLTLPLLSGKFRMAIFRELDAPNMLIADGLNTQAQELIGAFRFASGATSDENLAGFQAYLSHGLDYFVVRDSVLSHRKAVMLLDQAGYCVREGDWDGYAVFVRGECNTG